MASELSAALARVLPTIGPKNCLARGGGAPAVVVYVHNVASESLIYPSGANNLRHSLQPPGNGLKCVVTMKLARVDGLPGTYIAHHPTNSGASSKTCPCRGGAHTLYRRCTKDCPTPSGWTSHTRPSGQNQIVGQAFSSCKIQVAGTILNFRRTPAAQTFPLGG